MNTYNVNNLRIQVDDFVHPADQLAMNLLKKTPGFEKLVDFISKKGLERILNMLYKATRFQITREVSPEMFDMLDKANDMFGGNIDIEKIDMYIQRSYDCIVEVIGTERLIIDLTTATIEGPNDDMLWSILATRIAEIEANHNRMEIIGKVLKYAGAILPMNIAKSGIQTAFNAWQRSRVYTEDRAFLLACGDFNYACAHILYGQAPEEMLRKINYEDPENIYYKQAMDFVEPDDAVWNTLRKAKIFLSDDAWRPSRYINLYKWYMSGEYDEIVERSER